MKNFENKRFNSLNRKDEYLKYIEYRPKTDEKLPLVLYIHGAGGRGDDLTNFGNVGPMYELNNGRNINAVIIAPQCHCNTWFELFDVLLEFIDFCRNSDYIDSNRIYITGSSMGAYATYQVIMSRPRWFAAAVCVCGGGMYWNAPVIKNLPLWAFHGALDDVVLPEESIHMVKAINNAGGNAKITIYPNCDHGAWTLAFRDDTTWEWLFNQHL